MNMPYYDMQTGLKEMLGKTFTRVECDVDQMIFENDDEKYTFYHAQDCCEDVSIEDIVGDLKDLEGSPLLEAEQVDSSDEPPVDNRYEPDSYTWTFYKFATNKGHVNIRWYGTSNGYYSERVDLSYTKKEKNDETK